MSANELVKIGMFILFFVIIVLNVMRVRPYFSMRCKDCNAKNKDWKIVPIRCDDFAWKHQCKELDNDNHMREDCPVIGKPCDFFAYHCDRNDDVVLTYCKHLSNKSNYEGNCTSELCPILENKNA